MQFSMPQDVPSPIDLRVMADAREWEPTALEKRPARPEFFARFAEEIALAPLPVRRILELGSGPGFLADHLLQSFPSLSYVALDFSPAMHELASNRLGGRSAQVQFVERSFRDPDWFMGLGKFECVVTHQAIHELRHKCHASGLHSQVRQILDSGGIYLVCDHFAGDGGMQDDQLYMCTDEQRAALCTAGFHTVEQLMLKGSLVMHRAS
jgi:SAM-dependent methyltransferase